jgi:hypothetical protein
MAGDFYLIPYIRELGETRIRNLKGFEQGKLLAAIIHMVIFSTAPVSAQYACLFQSYCLFKNLRVSL